MSIATNARNKEVVDAQIARSSEDGEKLSSTTLLLALAITASSPDMAAKGQASCGMLLPSYLHLSVSLPLSLFLSLSLECFSFG